MAPERPPTLPTHDWEQWSTQCHLVVTQARALPEAIDITRRILTDVDRAASRFRPDSELMGLQGGPQQIGPLLRELVAAALDAAVQTDGALDLTVGGALIGLGYDRDIELVRAGTHRSIRIQRVAGWRSVRLEGDTLTLPHGVVLDLGATAKAQAADMCAAAVAEQLGVGVLVNLGGDIATAGAAPEASPDAEGWQVLIQDLRTDASQQVTLSTGAALATSSKVRRVWSAGQVHHLVDPHTSLPARGPWRTATVVAPNCLDANIAATATLVMGERGAAWLVARRLPGRLLSYDGHVRYLGGFPREGS